MWHPEVPAKTSHHRLYSGPGLAQPGRISLPQTWAYLEITESDFFRSALPTRVAASVFAKPGTLLGSCKLRRVRSPRRNSRCRPARERSIVTSEAGLEVVGTFVSYIAPGRADPGASKPDEKSGRLCLSADRFHRV